MRLKIALVALIAFGARQGVVTHRALNSRRQFRADFPSPDQIALARVATGEQSYKGLCDHFLIYLPGRFGDRPRWVMVTRST